MTLNRLELETAQHTFFVQDGFNAAAMALSVLFPEWNWHFQQISRASTTASQQLSQTIRVLPLHAETALTRYCAIERNSGFLRLWSRPHPAQACHGLERDRGGPKPPRLKPFLLQSQVQFGIAALVDAGASALTVTPRKRL
jgi:hypothetical protein